MRAARETFSARRSSDAARPLARRTRVRPGGRALNPRLGFVRASWPATAAAAAAALAKAPPRAAEAKAAKGSERAKEENEKNNLLFLFW